MQSKPKTIAEKLTHFIKHGELKESPKDFNSLFNTVEIVISDKNKLELKLCKHLKNNPSEL